MAVNQVAVAARAADIMQGWASAGYSLTVTPAIIAGWLRYSGDANPTDPFCISGANAAYAQSWLEAKHVAFTAANLIEVALSYKAEIERDMLPVSASCSATVAALGDRFTTVDEIGNDVSLPPGTLVIYTWPADQGGGHHAELLLADGGDTLQTAGANVGCHQVADRSRNWSCIWGFWIPDL